MKLDICSCFDTLPRDLISFQARILLCVGFAQFVCRLTNATIDRCSSGGIIVLSIKRNSEETDWTRNTNLLNIPLWCAFLYVK